MMAHFEKIHPSDVCNPQKVLIGTSKKSAATLLQLKYGAPPAAIVKELKSFQKIAKKSVPTKKVIQDYECEVCKYKHLDLSIVLRHKFLVHQLGENPDGKYSLILCLNIKSLRICSIFLLY